MTHDNAQNIHSVSLASSVQFMYQIKLLFFSPTAQVLLKTSLYSAIAVYAVIGLLACACAWLLPVETLGLQLNQSGQTCLYFCNKNETTV